MELIASLLIGVCLGGVIVLLFVRARLEERHSRQIDTLREVHSEQVAGLQQKAGSSEARVEELRQQLQRGETEMSRMQGQLDSERQ